MLALLAPVAGILHWIESWLAHDIAYRLLAEMRIDLYNKLDALAPAYLVRRRSGDLIALASQDIETIEYFFAHTVAPALVALLVPATVLLILAAVAWPIALALLPFVLYAGLAPVVKRARIDRLGGEARDALGLLGAYVTETIQGLSDLVAFQAVGRRRDGFMRAVAAYQRTRLALLSDLSSQTAQLEIVDRARRPRGRGGRRLAGRRAAARGDDAAAADPAGPRLVPADLGDRAGQPPARRHDRLDPPLLCGASGGAGGARRAGSAARAGRRLGDSLRRCRLRLSGRAPACARRRRPRHPGRRDGGDRRPVRAPARRTLANLLLRFWDPATGHVLIDGVDLRDFELDHLRRRISLVSQDTYLFNDTLRANVALARPDADEAAIHRALDQAALADFVASLPEGLDTRVGERGVQLSGGQRQRVAIARAFLKNAPTLILDEATSHLDAVSEAQVRGALDALMRDRTTIVIAHRLSTVRHADLLVVLDRGRVVELGSHVELVARNGLYARLIRRQLAGARRAGARRGRLKSANGLNAAVFSAILTHLHKAAMLSCLLVRVAVLKNRS